jgi:hypothetical protein
MPASRITLRLSIAFLQRRWVVTHPDQVRINEWWLREGLGASADIGLAATPRGSNHAMLVAARERGARSTAAAKAELVADGLIDEAGRLTQKSRDMGLRMPERPGRVNP